MAIDEESEKRFNAWIDSIKFVDEEGIVVDEPLSDDDSEDPEGDRG